jgi:hypothetical protein
MVATAVIGSAVVGAGASVAGSKSQQKGAEKSADAQLEMYERTRADLSPYNLAGQSALKDLQGRLNYLTSPIKMDQATLEKTPGYQFNLAQGLKSTQNSAAARGLGTSGAALKGAASYATGLADSTYQQQFANENTNRENAYNRLLGLVQSGQNAAAQTGSAGTAAATGAGQAYVQGGTATAAGYTGAANALTGGVNNLMTYKALGMYQ